MLMFPQSDKTKSDKLQFVVGIRLQSPTNFSLSSGYATESDKLQFVVGIRYRVRQTSVCRRDTVQSPTNFSLSDEITVQDFAL